MTVYLHFYGFREHPFSTTPDPKFLYLTASHREALAQLTYGVQEGKGCIVLTGNIGTGKTTLLRTLLNKLDTTTAVASVSNSMLPFESLLEYILEEYGITTPGASHVQRLLALKRFLEERHGAGLKTVLILDEAQNLAPATLEEVRLLSNFEAPGAKLLQILLVGQPELGAKLALPELRQLRQRIALRFTLGPLSLDETRNYIRSRLRMAGAWDLGVFSDRAIERIARNSGGIPRLINLLCDHCLLIGYADQRRRIDAGIVVQAARQLEGAEASRRSLGGAASSGSALRRWAVGTIAAAALAAGLAVFVLEADSRPLVGFARAAWDLVRP
jgi:general secretion pathway protein A